MAANLLVQLIGQVADVVKHRCVRRGILRDLLVAESLLTVGDTLARVVTLLLRVCVLRTLRSGCSFVYCSVNFVMFGN